MARGRGGGNQSILFKPQMVERVKAYKCLVRVGNLPVLHTAHWHVQILTTMPLLSEGTSNSGIK